MTTTTMMATVSKHDEKDGKNDGNDWDDDGGDDDDGGVDCDLRHGPGVA